MNHHSFADLDLVFESLGNAILLFDGDFSVVRAGRSFEKLVCEGAAARVIGRSMEEIFHVTMPQIPLNLKESLLGGSVEEERRAFLICPTGHTRLVSIIAAPFCRPPSKARPSNSRYILVIRPAEEENLTLQRAISSKGIVAKSDAMLNIVRLIEALYKSDATVLLTGESGTGKEVVARALHYHSPRRSGPFVAINCAAFPGDLLENELYGHAKGAYTGAHQAKPGRFEAAEGGTLFLDEIGDMPLPLQVKLLRVLQEKAFERLGESKTRSLNARVIAATNVVLEQAIRDGGFREDLYYRLKVVPIHIPPLRDRTEDIEVLAKHLLSQIASRLGKYLFLHKEAIDALCNYAWPGNVRELENALEFAATFCDGPAVGVAHLPAEILQAESTSGDISQLADQGANSSEVGLNGSSRTCPVCDAPAGADCPSLTLPENCPVTTKTFNPEREEVLAALTKNRWNKESTAKSLGISRTTLWRKMKRTGLG